MNIAKLVRFAGAALVVTVVGFGIVSQVNAMSVVKAIGPISVAIKSDLAIKGWVDYRVLVSSAESNKPRIERFRAANVQINVTEVGGSASWNTQTDSQGNYFVPVSDTKTYKVTPSDSANHVFTPVNRTVIMSGFDREVNFVGKLN